MSPSMWPAWRGAPGPPGSRSGTRAATGGWAARSRARGAPPPPRARTRCAASRTPAGRCRRSPHPAAAAPGTCTRSVSLGKANSARQYPMPLAQGAHVPRALCRVRSQCSDSTTKRSLMWCCPMFYVLRIVLELDGWHAYLTRRRYSSAVVGGPLSKSGSPNTGSAR